MISYTLGGSLAVVNFLADRYSKASPESVECIFSGWPLLSVGTSTPGFPLKMDIVSGIKLIFNSREMAGLN